MAIFYGDIDGFATSGDVKWLLDESQSGLPSKLVVFH
jgi:hypothetical protein